MTVYFVQESKLFGTLKYLSFVCVSSGRDSSETLFNLFQAQKEVKSNEVLKKRKINDLITSFSNVLWRYNTI